MPLGNLLAATAGIVDAVNPKRLLAYRQSIGYSIGANRKQVPAYATPGAFTASIVSGILTVTAVASGQLGPGQLIAGAGMPAGVTVNGSLGGGNYSLFGNPPDVASEAMTSTLTILGQVQALQYRDIAQLDGSTMNGTRRKVYLYGEADGTVRTLLKGGDLLVDGDGSVWLVAMAIEQWAKSWCSVAVTLQNS